MTIDAFIEAIGLPRDAVVGQRVPKTLLVEHGAPTAADKRLINDGIEEVRWLASLKPTTVGIAAFEDATRQCVELAILNLVPRATTKVPRLIELVHRAVPYHLLLLTGVPDSAPALSCADKRWSQNEGGKVVLDGDVVTTDLSAHGRTTVDSLLMALRITSRPQPNLYTLYRSWLDALIAAEAARKTGSFSVTQDPLKAAERQAALTRCAVIETEIAAIRSAAAKEKQLARQVDLNLRLKKLQADYSAAKESLT